VKLSVGLLDEAALRVLVQAADRIAQERRRAAGGVAVGGDAQRLLQGRLEAVEELVHAHLQALVLAHQRVAGHDAHHAGILLREREQHLDQLSGLPQARRLRLVMRFASVNTELSMNSISPSYICALEAKVAVERRFRDLQAAGERRGGDALPLRRLEHLRESLQDFEPAFAFGAGHGRSQRILCSAVTED
jgi:hypothetical protein